jgi:hypothetical protein
MEEFNQNTQFLSKYLNYPGTFSQLLGFFHQLKYLKTAMKAKETIFFCHFVVIFSLSLDICDCVEFVCEVATTTIIYAMWRLECPKWKTPRSYLGVTFIKFEYLDRCQLLPPKSLESFDKNSADKVQSKKDKGIKVYPPPRAKEG